MFRPDRLVEWRKKRKLTQEKLATKVNLTKAGISNYENGYSAPPHETLVAIADALDISTDYLLDRTDLPFSNNRANDDPAAPYINAMEQAKSGEGISEQSATGEVDDPKISRFFKDFKSAPKEKQEETIRFLEFLNQQEKGRKPGDKQGG